MARNRKALPLALFLLLVGGSAAWWGTAKEPADQRAKLMKAHKHGNYKDACDGLRKLALDPNDDPKAGPDNSD
jgi:hypothetical protein